MADFLEVCFHNLLEDSQKDTSVEQIMFSEGCSVTVKHSEEGSWGVGSWVSLATAATIRYLLSQPPVTGETWLELGAGTAVVSAALATCRHFQRCQFVATDQLPLLDLMRDNMALNASSVSDAGNTLHTDELNWGESAAIKVLQHKYGVPHCVLVVDCVYAEDTVQLLISTASTLAPGGRLLFAVERRTADLHTTFEHRLHENFVVDD
eukprot:gene10791-1962_t